MDRYPLVSRKIQGLIHGGDYFPEQWLQEPSILAEDLRLMKAARINAVSLGMFAWSALEPKEGTFCFEWLDRLMDSLAEQKVFAILATPSGARPAWMSRSYPEVLRVSAERRRNLHGFRHNHCYTSPVYREKTRIMNSRLAQRYGGHPALLMWHVSNEYGGECHCGLCQEAFRAWLNTRYNGNIERLNRAWWSSFWSHTYTDWSQVESPAPHGEPLMQGLLLDWKRFVTAQTLDFMLAEIKPLREHAPDTPVTTNMMGTYPGLDYWKLGRHIDVASWNSYPCWHANGPGPDGDFSRRTRDHARDWVTASAAAFTHDLMRSLKAGRPFLLMESSPTFSSWHQVWKLKRPGMHALSSLLAVAHGSDSVQYFQWRKGRGGPEKFHGAVIDHSGSENTRVFRDVAALGRVLADLAGVAGLRVPAQTAILFDWENRWALECASVTPPSGEDSYEAACKRHHRVFWAMGVPTDVIDMDQDFSRYRLIVAPMLYMVRAGVAERLEAFVRAGGTLVLSCPAGQVDENDLCFPGGFPGPLRMLLGIWSEESDGLYPGERNRLVLERENLLRLSGAYAIGRRCELIHAESARVLGRYGEDFYHGRPAFTVNDLGTGMAFYIAANTEERFLADLYRAITRRLGLPSATGGKVPEGVCARVRTSGGTDYLFLLNFTDRQKTLTVNGGPWVEAETGAPLVTGRRGAPLAPRVTLGPFGYKVLVRSGAP